MKVVAVLDMHVANAVVMSGKMSLNGSQIFPHEGTASTVSAVTAATMSGALTASLTGIRFARHAKWGYLHLPALIATASGAAATITFDLPSGYRGQPLDVVCADLLVSDNSVDGLKGVVTVEGGRVTIGPGRASSGAVTAFLATGNLGWDQQCVVYKLE